MSQNDRKAAYSAKRVSERKQVQIAVTLVIEGSEGEYRATTVDVSPHGMRLLSDATLAADQRVRLHLRAAPAQFVNARVAWVGQTDSANAGQAGFEFLNPHSGLVH
jgi:c-di-GMP-binding flagellar brake protein YcgR